MIVPSMRCRSLIGRDAELQMLRDMRRSLSNGRGGVALIGGDAGIGKTRLLSAFTESLTGGRAPLFALGECLEHAPLAFGPIRQILASLASRAPWATAAAPPLARRTLRTLVPDVGDSPHPTNGETVERAELFSGVLAYLATIAAKRALVVAIEDLHWADAASLELLTHVCARIGSMRLMIVATYRDGAMPAKVPLFSALARLSRMPTVATVTLEPLASGDLATLVTDALGGRFTLASDRMHDIVTRSEGNPLFAEELLKRAVTPERPGDRLPISIRAIVLERLEALDARARLVLEQAAVLGAHFSISELAVVSGRSARSLESIVTQLRACDLIAQDVASSRYRFRHALTRDAVYSEIPAAAVRRMHERIVKAFADLPDAADRIDALAYHSWKADLGAIAGDFNERAGERAMQLRAPAHAATCFSRALALVAAADAERRLRLLERIGTAASQICDFPAAIAAFTQVHDARLAQGDVDAAGTALLRAANDIANTNRGVEAIASLRSFLATYEERLSQAATDHLNSQLAYLATTQEAHELVPQLLSNVRDPARMATHPHEAFWLARLFTAERNLDRPTWRSAVRSIRGRLDEAHALAHGQLLHSIGQTALTFAENDEAERALDEAIAYDREHGLTHAQAFASALKIRLLLLRGRLTEAIPLIHFTLANRDLVAVRSQLMMGAPYVALAVGDSALARRCVDDEIFANTREGPQVMLNAAMSTAMAAWLRSEGRVEEARTILGLAVDALEQPFTDASFWCLAASVVERSKLDRLRALCAAGAGQPDAVVMQATRPLVEAVVAERAGNASSAREFAAEAAERFRRLGWPLFEARAREVAGDRDAALAAFRACESVADVRRMEMQPLPPVARLAIPGALSPREREVAALIARGRTNRAIAAELHISENTVEKHVTKIYMKLEFSTRAELAAYVSRASTAGPAVTASASGASNAV